MIAEVARDMGLAAIPAVGFGMLFNVPTRVLVHCAVLGAACHGSRFVLLRLGVPIEVATLIAACGTSFTGVWWSRSLRAHPKVFTVAAVIPMVPGVPLFTALITLQQIYQRGASLDLLTQAINSGLRAVIIIAAIGVGLSIPGLVYYRRRPVV